MRTDYAIAFVFIAGAALFIAVGEFFFDVLEVPSGLSEEELRILQIKITAVSAFTGFLAAAVVKFGLDLLIDSRKRKTEASVLATALQAELRHANETLKDLRYRFQCVTHQEEFAEGKVEYIRSMLNFPETQIYHASIGKLGLLGDETAKMTIEAFSSLQRLKEIADLIAAYHNGSPAKAIKEFDDLLERMIWVTLPMHNADKSLSKIVGVPPEIPDPIPELELASKKQQDN